MQQMNEVIKLREEAHKKYLAKQKEEQLKLLEELEKSIIKLDQKLTHFANNFYDYFSGAIPYVEALESFLKDINDIYAETKKLLPEPTPIPYLDNCIASIQELLNKIGDGFEHNKEHYVGPLAYQFWKFQSLIIDEHQRILKEENFVPFKLCIETHNSSTRNIEFTSEREIIVPDDILSTIYLTGLKSCKTENQAKEYFKTFSRLSRQHHNIANKPIFLTYIKGFHTRDGKFSLDYAIASLVCEHEISKKYNHNELELLLSHPNATPNLYIIVNKEGKPVKGWNKKRILCYREEALSEEQHDDIQGEDCRAKPIAFLTLTNNDFRGFNLFTKAKANLSLASRSICRKASDRGSYFEFMIDRKISLFQEILLSGNETTLNFYIKENLSLINAPMPSGETPLEYAITTPNKEMVTVLLKHKAVLGVSIKNLHMAAKNGHIEVVKTLLDEKVNINSFYDNQTPLASAILGLQIEVVEYLLKQGANTTIKVQGVSFLEWAIHRSNFEIFTLLLNKTLEGLNANQAQEVKNNLLRYAIKRSELTGDVRHTLRWGEGSMQHIVTVEYEKILKFLFKNTTLSKKGIAKEVCEAGTNICNFSTAAEELFNKLPDDEALSLFHHMVSLSQNAWVNACRVLPFSLKHKDLHLENNELSQNFFHILAQAQAATPIGEVQKNTLYKHDIIERLKNYLKITSRYGEEVICELFKKKDMLGKCPAHYFLNSFHFDLYFIESIYPALLVHDNDGYMPLHYAAKKLNNKDFSDLLSELTRRYSININQIISMDKRSLLHMAVIHKNKGAIKCLLNKTDIDLDAKDSEGKRAIDYAQNDNEILNLFLNRHKKDKKKAFEKIYNALYDAETSIFKGRHFVNNNQEYAFQTLEDIAKLKPDCRVAKAWELTKNYYKDCNYDNKELVKEIYKYGFKHSNVLARSKVAKVYYSNGPQGPTFWSSNSVNSFLRENPIITAEKMLALYKPGSRTEKICKALNKCEIQKSTTDPWFTVKM